VWIVGEQWLASGAHRSVDDPVVRTERLEARVAEQQIGDGGVSL
jgi:hypothetical protein